MDALNRRPLLYASHCFLELFFLSLLSFLLRLPPPTTTTMTNMPLIRAILAFHPCTRALDPRRSADDHHQSSIVSRRRPRPRPASQSRSAFVTRTGSAPGRLAWRSRAEASIHFFIDYSLCKCGSAATAASMETWSRARPLQFLGPDTRMIHEARVPPAASHLKLKRRRRQRRANSQGVMARMPHDHSPTHSPVVVVVAVIVWEGGCATKKKKEKEKPQTNKQGKRERESAVCLSCMCAAPPAAADAPCKSIYDPAVQNRAHAHRERE